MSPFDTMQQSITDIDALKFGLKKPDLAKVKCKVQHITLNSDINMWN